jgi:hypothetical protein
VFSFHSKDFQETSLWCPEQSAFEVLCGYTSAGCFVMHSRSAVRLVRLHLPMGVFEPPHLDYRSEPYLRRSTRLIPATWLRIWLCEDTKPGVHHMRYSLGIRLLVLMHKQSSSVKPCRAYLRRSFDGQRCSDLRRNVV